MGIDQHEARRRKQADNRATPKYNTDPNKPYAALPHRVIDSPAFMDLKPSDAKLLLLLVRQLSKDNNGQLQATHSYLSKWIGAEKTIQRSIQSLIDHGFIFRAKAGAYGLGAARYAVTWLPVGKDRSGLTHLDGFRKDAWHLWCNAKAVLSNGAKNPSGRGINNRSKIPCQYGKNVHMDKFAAAKNTVLEPVKNTDDVCKPCIRVAGGGDAHPSVAQAARSGAWISGYLERLADAGLAGAQCFQIPSKVLQ